MVPEEGVFRGKSALVNLRDGSAREQIVRAEVAQHVAFEHGGWTSQSYPSSLMGAMALVRQSLMDAEHYAAAWDHYQASPLGRERPETNLSLAALASALSREVPFCLEAEDVNMLLRGASLFREFELVPWVVLGDADAYRWLGEVQDAGAPLVLSLNFPPLPEWEDDTQEPDVSHAALRHAMLAPACPASLEQARVPLVFVPPWREQVEEDPVVGLRPERPAQALLEAGRCGLVDEQHAPVHPAQREDIGAAAPPRRAPFIDFRAARPGLEALGKGLAAVDLDSAGLDAAPQQLAQGGCRGEAAAAAGLPAPLPGWRAQPRRAGDRARKHAAVGGVHVVRLAVKLDVMTCSLH